LKEACQQRQKPLSVYWREMHAGRFSGASTPSRAAHSRKERQMTTNLSQTSLSCQ